MDDDLARQYLHAKLEERFPDMAMVVYRPPGDLYLDKPCIVYEDVAHEPSFANNVPFVVGTKFNVTILSDLPGYGTPKDIYRIEGVTVTSSRSHVTKDIAHNVFTVSVNTI
jgi:hypothetical protein